MLLGTFKIIKMKQLLFLLLFSMVSNVIQAQIVNRQKDCGTIPPIIKPVVTSEMRQKINSNRILYTTPYPLKVFIIVYADDNGTNLAATEFDVMRQFENMRIAYNPHEVCFVLAGYEVRNSTDLNNMNVGEADDRTQVTNAAISNCFTLFVHRTLVDGADGLNGTAYDIPNHFFSMSSGAINSTTNLSTMPHELGHCLGLLHTFEDFYGAENRARSGSCKDCEDDGDLLCDTQADRNVDDDLISVNCVYFGSATDACGEALLMEETNIMTYGRRACREFFTAGQRGRFTDFILGTHENRIAENSIIILPNSFVSGRITHSSRTSISFSPGVYSVSGTAAANFSSRSITLSPGVEFKPTSNYVEVRANGVYCP